MNNLATVPSDLNVLFVEDNQGDVYMVKQMLETSATRGFQLTTVAYLADAITTLNTHSFDAILLVLFLPDNQWLDTFVTLKKQTKNLPIIICTMLDDESAGIQAVQQGAQDYVVKEQLTSVSLTRTILYAIERHRNIQQLRQQTTELQQTNHQLQENAIQLEIVNSELESFAYSVTHELRNPLTAILGNSLLLRSKYGRFLDDKALNYLDAIQAEGKQINSLIDDLMQLSGIVQREVNVERVNLSVMTQTIMDRWRNTNPQRLVQVEITPNIVVRSDRALLLIVLENLLGNAWKYTRTTDPAYIEFGVTTASTLASSPQSQSLLPFSLALVSPTNEIEWVDYPIYFVRDNGIGFSLSQAKQIFNPFNRLHTRSEFEGNGIGLATVKRIIDRLGGYIWAVSPSDQGATFYFTFPTMNMANE